MAAHKLTVNIPEGLSLRAHYTELASYQIFLRDTVMEELGISLRTFYDRIKWANWTELEKKALCAYFEKPIEELFPQDEADYQARILEAGNNG